MVSLKNQSAHMTLLSDLKSQIILNGCQGWNPTLEVYFLSRVKCFSLHVKKPLTDQNNPLLSFVFVILCYIKHAK